MHQYNYPRLISYGSVLLFITIVTATIDSRLSDIVKTLSNLQCKIAWFFFFWGNYCVLQHQFLYSMSQKSSIRKFHSFLTADSTFFITILICFFLVIIIGKKFLIRNSKRRVSLDILNYFFLSPKLVTQLNGIYFDTAGRIKRKKSRIVLWKK